MIDTLFNSYQKKFQLSDIFSLVLPIFQKNLPKMTEMLIAPKRYAFLINSKNKKCSGGHFTSSTIM